MYVRSCLFKVISGTKLSCSKQKESPTCDICIVTRTCTQNQVDTTCVSTRQTQGQNFESFQCNHVRSFNSMSSAPSPGCPHVTAPTLIDPHQHATEPAQRVPNQRSNPAGELVPALRTRRLHQLIKATVVYQRELSHRLLHLDFARITDGRPPIVRLGHFSESCR